MWAELLKGIGILGLIGVLFRFHNGRMNVMEADRKKEAKARKLELYQPDGQTNYVLRREHNDHCKVVQETFCSKVDGVAKTVAEVKALIMDIDGKRETAKDLDHEVHKEIGERLAGIEAKLP